MQHSKYYNQNLSDTLFINNDYVRSKSVELFNDSDMELDVNTLKAYCDNISLKGDNYYISFFFKANSSWKWEITNAANEVIYKKTSTYPKGYYVEVWDGRSLKGIAIDQGIYILNILDSNNNLIHTKKFIIS